MSAALLLTSFILIFLAAAPGRTTFVLVMLAARGGLRSIFAGAAAAFLVQSVISVLLGQILALFPQWVVELVAGLLFLFFAYSFWRESRDHGAVQLRGSDKNLSARSVFFLIFMAEFGDVSQLAIAATAARSLSKFTVFVAAVSALWVLTVIALFVGHHLKRLVRPYLIQRVASLGFFGVGVFLLYRVAKAI